MAIDLCSENASMSPRLSFSHDLSLSDILPIEHRPFRSNSTGPNSSFDFDFIPLDHEPSSADEIFSEGKLLPVDIKKKPTGTTTSSLAQNDHPKTVTIKKQDSSSSRASSTEADDKRSLGSSGSSGSTSSSSSKSFWRFKRSTSLNCGGGHGRSLGLCPLPLLSRSNSTGSAPDTKNPAFPKESNHENHPNIKRHSPRNANFSSPLKPPQAAASASSFSGGYQKPPLIRKGNGMKVNPVLNMPSGNLFGLSSVFFTGKDKTRRK